VHFMSLAITRCKIRVNTEREWKSHKMADEVSSLLQKGKEDYTVDVVIIVYSSSFILHWSPRKTYRRDSKRTEIAALCSPVHFWTEDMDGNTLEQTRTIEVASSEECESTMCVSSIVPSSYTYHYIEKKFHQSATTRQLPHETDP
jgi:hypothetical protein